MAKILLIDDDEKLGGLLSAYFERFDLELVSATLPSVGLEKLRSEKPDLVLLDIALPKLDGFQVLERIRAMDAKAGSVPVLLTCAGRISPQHQERAEKLGAQALLSKPVPLDVLMILLPDRKVLPSRPTARVVIAPRSDPA